MSKTAVDSSAWRALVLQFVAIAVIACLPASRTEGHRARTRPRRLARHVGRAVAAGVVCISALLILTIARGVRSNFELGVGGAIGLGLLIVMTTIVSRPIIRGLLSLADRVAVAQPMPYLANRAPHAASIRFAVSVAVVTASVVTVLGASVEARTAHGTPSDVVDAIPAQAPNVVYVDALTDLTDTNAIPTSTAATMAMIYPTLSARSIAEVRNRFHGARVIPVREVQTILAPPTNEPDDGGLAVAGLFSGTVCQAVVADPEFDKLFGRPATTATDRCSVRTLTGHKIGTVTAYRHRATAAELVDDARAGRRLPSARFQGFDYMELPTQTVRSYQLPTELVGMFVVLPRDTTRNDVNVIERIVSDRLGPGIQAAVYGRYSPTPTGQRFFCLADCAFDRYTTNAPLAATSALSRWGAAGLATLLVLFVMTTTLTVDTLDRRAAVARWERLGAAPSEVRGAAALHAIALVGSICWFSGLVAVLLVKLGVNAFNDARPGLAIPFTVPWAHVATLLIGLPLAAGLVAAVVARPVGFSARRGTAPVA